MKNKGILLLVVGTLITLISALFKLEHKFPDIANSGIILGMLVTVISFYFILKPIAKKGVELKH